MGNKLFNRWKSKESDESQLVYCYISIETLKLYVLKLSTENTSEYLMYILKQYPICINVKFNGDKYQLSSHFTFIKLTFEQLINFSLLEDNKPVKIGISKFQYDYLELY